MLRGLILQAGVDQLRPLHPPLELDAPPTVPWALLLVVLALAALGVLVLARRSQQARLGPAAVAERELVRLLGLHLPEQGRTREHYALLAACLRRYVAEVYRLPASALTPAELATALAPQTVDPAFVEHVRLMLFTGDLVRFDHTSKTAEQARVDVLSAIDVIRSSASLPARSAV